MPRFHFFTAKQSTWVHKDDRGPYLKSDQQIDVPAEQLLHLTPKTLGNVPRPASVNK